MHSTKFSLAILGLMLPLFLSSCFETTAGIDARAIETKSPAETPISSSIDITAEGAIELLAIDVKQALELAVATLDVEYPLQAEIFQDSSVYILNLSYFEGNVETLITPVLVKDRDSDATGIYYKAVSRSYGISMPSAPGYVIDDFFRELPNQIDAFGYATVVFESYDQLGD